MRDHLGRFFAIMAEMRSEYIGIGFALVKKNRPVNRHFISHSDADGISGLYHFLRQQGFEAKPAKPPRPLAKPAFYSWPWLALRSLGDKGPYAFRNAARPRNMPDHFRGDHTPNAESHLVFSAAETRQISAAAANQHISVNSYLLAALHAVLYPQLTDQKGPQIWVIPVDLRPWLRPTAADANLFSLLFLGLGPDTTPETVHAALRAQLQKQRHWHFWLKLRLASRLGIFERLRRRAHKTEFHFGENKKLSFTFSNLGAWHTSTHCRPVLFSPPPNISAPVAIGAVTVNDRLTLTLRTHPVLPLRSPDLSALLKKVRAALLRRKTATTFASQARRPKSQSRRR